MPGYFSILQALRGEKDNPCSLDTPGLSADLSCPAFSGQGILRLFTRLPAFPAARP